MRRNLQAFLFSLSGLLAVGGSGLVVLWAVEAAKTPQPEEPRGFSPELCHPY
jgi:hypothetical protein